MTADAPTEAIRQIVREEIAAARDEIVAGPPVLLSVDQAARQLGIGRTGAFDLIRSGELRSHTIGRRRLVSTPRSPSSSRRRAMAARPVRVVDELLDDLL